MAWVWDIPLDSIMWKTDPDIVSKPPDQWFDRYSEVPVPLSKSPCIYRSRTGLKKFKQFHCPRIDYLDPTVDAVWRDIILRFVPADRIQFYPIRLIARGEVCDDYMFVIPFDRVRCIDTERSVIPQKIEKPDITLIFRVAKYVHIDGCLKDKHLARDEQQLTHLVLSEELHDALAVTGEDSMFFQPEDIPGLF